MSLNDFFDDKYFNSFMGYTPKVNTRTNTPCNIYQENGSYVFDLYLPGFSRDDFSIDIDNNVLYIKGVSTNPKKRNYIHQEYIRTTKFERSWSLPKNVNIDAIDASYNSGVLSISIPLLEERKPQTKKITIN